jgi:GT2 family glycosyltransferase
VNTKVTVGVCAHAMDRLELTVECVKSVWGGSSTPAAVIVVVDRNVPLRLLLTERLASSDVVIMDSDGAGASLARNTALGRCNTEILLFIDDDARADVRWLEEMAAAFDQPDVVGVGGRVVPAWADGAIPLPPELYWIVGATYKGHPLEPCSITRPIGASMGIRTAAMRELGGFSADFGPRYGNKSSYNEELALFTGLRRRWGGDSVRYAPDAVVLHKAPAERTTWRYLAKRSWIEGKSKADIRSTFGGDVLAYDGGYVRSTLLPGICRYAGSSLRGDTDAARSALMCAGALAITGVGYSWQRGKIARIRPGKRRVATVPCQ